MSVVAEGVETREQADILRKMGCRYAQGFYFSRPLSAAMAGSMLLSGVQEEAIAIPEVC